MHVTQTIEHQVDTASVVAQLPPSGPELCFSTAQSITVAAPLALLPSPGWIWSGCTQKSRVFLDESTCHKESMSGNIFLFGGISSPVKFRPFHPSMFLWYNVPR